MIHRKSSSTRIREVECPSCGCPNKPGDIRCMYCREELNSGSAAFKAAVAPYISNLREFLNPEPSSKRGLPAWKLALSVLMSAGLFGIGVLFILKGMQDGGHFNWTVGILLVAYGVAALRNTYISAR